MKRNVSPERATNAAPKTMFTAGKAGKLIGPLRDWTRDSLRRANTFGKYPAIISRNWNFGLRSRRDDTPPAATAVIA